MKTSAAKIYLKTPERKWLWLGGLAACILPLVCALILGALAWVAGQFTDDGIVDERANYFSSLVVMAIPLVGAALASYFGVREIRKKNKHGFSSKGSFAWIALKSGFIAHWLVAGFLFVFLLALGRFSMFGSGIIFIKIIFLGSFYTFLLWGFLTLPLSLVCGYIFWFVAVRRSENLMAEVFD